MKIGINEQIIDVPVGSTLANIREKFKPNSDVCIVNGALIPDDIILQENDQVMLIKRGVMPPRDELEFVMAARHTPGVHAKMKTSVVGIAGLGGLGSAVAVALARMGVGRLVLVDFDVVEPSNLNRQQYFVDQLGQHKTLALQENLKRINPYIQIDCHTDRIVPENVDSFFCDIDVLVEAFDGADQKAMLMQNVGNYPLVTASGLAGHGSGESIKVHKIGDSIYVVGDLQTGAKPGCGLMAPRVGIAAHMQANLVVQILLGDYE